MDAGAREAPAFDRFLAVKHFGSLDGLRFLSILAVLWHHSGIEAHLPLLERGQLGVHLFFAISGFLITSLMIRERRANGCISLSRFYMRRSLRIFPLYYAVLLAYVLVVAVVEKGTEDGREFFANLPAFATYTSNWFVRFEHEGRVIFYFAWSLAVEEQFYLTWPWVERYLGPRAKGAVLAALIGLVFANHVGLLLWLVPPTSLLYRVLWYIAPCILFGVVSAYVLHHPRGFRAAWSFLGRRSAAPALFGVLLALLSLDRDGMLLEYLVYACLVSLVVACTIREDNGLAPLLRWKPLARVGTISYGVYLMHMLCFNAVERLAHRLGLQDAAWIWVGGLVLVYGVAEISFRTFEAFFQRFLSRYRSERSVAAHVTSDAPRAAAPTEGL